MHPVEVPYQHRKAARWVCDICPVHCSLREGDVGICTGRKVVEGRLVATNYGEVAASHLDPIEKKPLYHFRPGSLIWSVGPNGCNFRCPWCQNCDISQFNSPTMHLAPAELRDHALRQGSVGIAYTYAEPLIWYETIRDTAPGVREAGGVNVLVTNGYICPEPLNELLPWIDAANVDLKTLDEQVYKRLIGGDVAIVQRNILRMLEAGIHVELTHLLVTGIADELDTIERLARWVAALDRRIPLHLSRYFPHHKSAAPQTSLTLMERAWALASNHLDFVYMGNVSGRDGKDTLCPSCGTVCIRRSGYQTVLEAVDSVGGCGHCGQTLNLRLAT